MKKLGKVLADLLRSEAGRRRPMRILWRFFYWQWRQRVSSRPLEFRTVTGSKLSLVPREAGALSGFYYLELPDFEEQVFALHLLRPGELFIDVGANQGGWTLLLAGAGSRVIAFEPVPATFARMHRQIAGNTEQIRRLISARQLALGEQSGTVDFTASLDEGNHRIAGDTNRMPGDIRVPLETLDSALRDETPFLIKIDVEGSELMVLQGAKKILKAPSLLGLIIETFRPHNHRQEKLIALEAMLLELGFRPHAYDPWSRQLRRLNASGEGAQNTIYARSDIDLQTRLKAAVAVTALACAI